ncbi:hypothetical protein [Aureliella helgolandensis]|uniref:Lipase (Class 3) n=1 Tax=Aureliella helgolandensis TaxID=2527968 RepID=A0A518G4M6_9BACT|nr:hypothetical protein [Aureliella helgolandensis]QDV23532.1 hypothetical protein Q31a_18330 [Aureliella helgolandensis]
MKLYDGGTSDSSRRVLEGQEISITIELEGSSSIPQTLIIFADLNFNGKLDLGEQVHQRNILNANGVYGVSFHIPDDGPWPGNETPTDPLEVEVDFAGETDSLTLEVVNVPPRLVGRPQIGHEVDSHGDAWTVLQASFLDPGIHDLHTASVTWADGTTANSNVFSQFYTCSNTPAKTVEFRLPRVYGDSLYPLTLTVSDDDQGAVTYPMLEMDVLRNDDDDDESGLSDQFERGFLDDDLLPVDFTPMLTEEMSADDGRFYLSYDLSTIRLWDSPQKNNLVLPYMYYAGGPSDMLTVPTLPYTGQETLYVEGIALHRTPINLTWAPTQQDNSSPFDSCNLNSIQVASLDVMVWGIDLDIDSDNDNGTFFPELDDWEEELESNRFAIGKMLYKDANQFTPLVIQLPTHIPPSEIVIRLEELRKNKPSGTINIWDAPKYNANRRLLGTPDGDLIGDFTLSELNYNPYNGRVVLWLEAIQITTGHDVKIDVDTLHKPDDRIKATIWSTSEIVKATDEVKYMAVNANTFFPALNSMPELRSAAAAEAVYAKGSHPDMSLQYIDQEQVEKWLEDSDLNQSFQALILTYLFNARRDIGSPIFPLGFKAGLYRDYVSGGYIISFAGTDLDTPEDLISNVRQLLTNGEPQYIAAMDLTYYLAQLSPVESSLSISGHSLGGGMASAASLLTGIQARTFNAAGLQPHTIPLIPAYRAAMLNFDRAESLITAYAVNEFVSTERSLPDLLTFLQTHVTALPRAVGRQVSIEGHFNLFESERTQFDEAKLLLRSLPDDLDEWKNQFLTIAAKISIALGKIPLASFKMFRSHQFDAIYYGILHTDPNWNVYDHDAPR